MRIFFYAIVMLCTAQLAFAQAPVNDDCDNPIDLGTVPFCDSLTLYNNFEATASKIGMDSIPDCFKGGASDNDVWFTFTTTTATEYLIIIEGVADTSLPVAKAIATPEFEIYDGTCQVDGLTETNNCASAVNGANSVSIKTGNLEENKTYFLRVNCANLPGVNNGSFYVCTEQFLDKLSIDMGGSPLCEGQVYDTGGPDTTYQNNEDYIFTICPDSMFGCLLLSMDSYMLETKPNMGGDYFKIYDGPDTTGTIIGSSADMRDTTNKSTFSGINNAVCLSYYAESGCMTIYWHSDSSVVSEGFVASWKCVQDSCPSFDSLLVFPSADGDQIVSTIQGRLIEITVEDIQCADTAYGVFDAQKTDIGLADGLLLTTGRADSVMGPNDLPDYGFNNDTIGYPLLDSLSLLYGDTTTTHDACVVEMEFRPETDVMQFDMTIGSDEYAECLIEGLTDIAGIFYTTAGFTGTPGLGNYTNIATLQDPGGMSSTDVQIANMNPNDSSFWSNYRNTTNSQSHEYDGMITGPNGMPKYIRITQNVEPCQANELIAAIADRGDSLYDSGLFLSNIRCLTPSISFFSGLGFNFFIETCDPGLGMLTFTFPRQYDVDTEWDVTFEGDAVPGVDFTWTHGSSITLPANQQSVSYDIDVIDDGLNEGPEMFKIKLSRDWGCGDVELTELDILIRDRLITEIENAEPFACEGERVEIWARQTADGELLTFTWEPENILGSGDQDTVDFIATDDIQIVLTGTIIHPTATCTWTDTFDIQVLKPRVSITSNDTMGICVGESVDLSSTDNVGGNNRQWRVIQGSANLSSTTNQNITVSPTSPGQVVVQVRVDTLGCPATFEWTIEVDQLDTLNLIDDTQICFNESINLTTNTTGGSSTFDWTPASSLDDPTSFNPVASPPAGRTTTYKVVYTSENEYCSGEDSVSIEVIPEFFPALSDPGNPCVQSADSFMAEVFTIEEIGIADSILSKYNPTYVWEVEAGINLVDVSGDQRSARFTANDDGIVRLIVTIGDCEIIVERDVRVSEPGRFSWTIDPDSVIVNCAEVYITLDIAPGSSTVLPEDVTWWFLPEGGTVEDRDFFGGEGFTVSRITRQSGTFNVGVVDNNNCYHENMQTVEVVTPLFKVPNVFSPNGDQMNDLFRVYFEEEDLEYEVRSIKIYNRWGELVFEGNGNEGWDGTIDGEDAIATTYLYVIEMYDACGERIFEDTDPDPLNEDPLQGDVTLIR